ncbi:Mth938-like domain-containing protein [Ramlibacter alkalitolerans]|uniref:Mth938-like domain-containing protein n=1 Tax=Ramlibacter alkalitolerans TaxID=2039631 RepID=A0ABS1JX03_9BURK|nr:Mth938-like domain-containing protein [Ramlibacter alkalitolerans]MBL0428040.1 Mth938-like domain-containing protein [Ramlibacter alkalitolerans]
MKLQPDRSDAQTITGYGPGWVGVGTGAGTEKITHNVVIASNGERLPWAGRYEDLGPADFAAIAELKVEVVIFGSGARIRFPKPAWLAPLAEARIGIETMDTAAACRTYNILAQEGREVAVALLLESA